MAKILLLMIILLTPLLFPFFDANALSIQVVTPSISITDSKGSFIEYGKVNQQLVLSMTFQSNIDTEQPFMAILEVRDSAGITSYLTWSSNVVSPYENTTVGVSWMPNRADSYEVRTFAISDLENPQILTTVESKKVEIIDVEKTPVTFIEHVGEPRFEILNYTLKEAQELAKKIWRNTNCHIYSYTEEDAPESYQDWLPQKVNFEYIQPSQPITRTSCLYSPLGISYLDFVIINGTHFALPESVISIQNAEQAVEYLKYFQKHHESFLIDEQAYTDALKEADLIEHSPIRWMHVIDNGDSFVIRVNVLDAVDSQLRYEK